FGSAASAGATAGSAAAAGVSAARTGPASATVITAAPSSAARRRKASEASTGTAQLLDLRHEHVLQRIGRDRADVLVADAALAIDQEGFRHAIHAEVDADAAVDVEHRQHVGVAMVLEPGARTLDGHAGLGLERHAARVDRTVATHFLVVEADHGHQLLLRHAHQHRMLLATGDAPRGPHVEQPHLALHFLQREGLLGLI